MGRILAIDYGKVRTGIAVTDTSQIIASGLTTVETPKLMTWLKNYCQQEEVEAFVLGDARHMDNTPSESMKYIEPFAKQLAKVFPDKPIHRVDERFTSKMAFQSMIDSGLKKKQRQNKGLIDTISAALILQTFLDTRRNMSR
ncbi:MAG: Holliday junction resolvase RuvX [Bacteroidales bacterium]|nr:Holliday junction resolvase RuvX [Bacteroidales bacterium]